MSSVVSEEYIYGKENRKNDVNVLVAVQIVFFFITLNGKMSGSLSLGACATGPEEGVFSPLC